MNDDEISALQRAEDMPTVRTQTDLWRHWRALMGELGFSERLLWIALFGSDGRAAPVLQQVSDMPMTPDAKSIDDLMRLLRELTDMIGDGSAALLMSRPGRVGLTADERSWARALAAAARDRGVRLWPLHLVNDRELVTVTPDDLVAAG